MKCTLISIPEGARVGCETQKTVTEQLKGREYVYKWIKTFFLQHYCRYVMIIGLHKPSIRLRTILMTAWDPQDPLPW